MPIQLDQLTGAKTSVKSLTPKYFDNKLTGSGKKTGLLSESVRPNNVSLTQTHSIANNPIARKAKHTAGDITTNYIPLAPMLQQSLEGNTVTMAIPDKDQMFQVFTKPGDPELWFDLTPQALVLREDNGQQHGVGRELLIQYRMELYRIVNDQDPKALVQSGIPSRSVNQVMLEWTFNAPRDALPLIQSALTSGKPNTYTLVSWMDDYDVHDRICQLAEEWASDDLAIKISEHVAEMGARFTGLTTSQLDNLAYQLRYLETYGVSLSAYRDIHAAIKAAFPEDVASTLCKQNLNLLMNATLENLEQMKGQLSSPPQPANGALAVVQTHFSTQQKQAVTTDEPLVLVQAGAGTGKSTAILGRIEHLVSRGVTPEDITVLSFTNAAADNIATKNPAIGSMTIARMIHDIYNENYTGHELSSIDTIINSLDIFYRGDDVARELRHRLLLVAKNEEGAFTSMNTFIERNFDTVMDILNHIKQTSLELEIIVCYQKIDDLKEPAHVTSRYLIIDEVQDNSIFEFIFVLKYVAKHMENLYIVGDCSQTLYEFRSSNPKALNALESSGVFATFKLTTNYRSNQEILDFANVALADIEANQFANIQLQANSLVMPTAASFQEKVTLNYRCYPRVTEFPKDLGGIIINTVREYIDTCLARGEKVAFLAHTRREVAIIESALKERWPSREISNLVPNKAYATTVFSAFIKDYWNLVTQVSPKDASFVVTQEIINNLDKISRNAAKAEPQVRTMISQWWLDSATSINGWVALYNAGQLSRDQFFTDLRQCLLDHEIKHNAVKQSLMSQRNKIAKEKNLSANADFIISTIHSAKGLEFDNVVVVHRYDSQMKEADKRMFYVAFTRAMNTEYILSYGTLKNARIESDYKLLVQALEERDAANAMRAIAGDDEDVAGIDDGSIDDLEDITDVPLIDPTRDEPDGEYDATDNPASHTMHAGGTD